MRVDLDIPVHCVDGGFGELADVVIDPETRRLTHLVVQPKHAHGQAWLVPIESTDGHDRSRRVQLGYTIEQVTSSDPIQESAFLLPGEALTGEPEWDVGIQEMYPLPESGALGPLDIGSGLEMDYDQHVAVSFHRVPKGAIEIRRESPVTSSDGEHLGHVAGFVIDEAEEIIHLVLEHGHLWGKRQVAIPGSAIERLETDDVRLSLSSDAVGALKPLPRT